MQTKRMKRDRPMQMLERWASDGWSEMLSDVWSAYGQLKSFAGGQILLTLEC